MRPPLLYLLAFFMLGVPRVQAAEELVIDAAVDIPLTLAPFSVWSVLFFTASDRSYTPGPQPDAPTGLDGYSPFAIQSGPKKLSDIILYGSMGAGLVFAGVDGALGGNAGARSLLYMQALAFNGVATDITKNAIRRPRPYTWDETTGDSDDYLSFFSGHASTTAVVSFTTARSVDITHDLSPAQRIALYGGATALTATVSGARVAAGKHFISDVVVGSLVGASIGWLVPELHRSSRHGVASVGTGQVDGTSTVTLSGRF